jgi:hypothetical protein
MLKKKILANYQRIITLFTQKIVNKLQKKGFGIRDPRSGIRDPGSGKNLFRIPDPDPQHWIHSIFYPKIFTNLAKYRLKIRDPEKNLSRIRSKITGYRIQFHSTGYS